MKARTALLLLSFAASWMPSAKAWAQPAASASAPTPTIAAASAAPAGADALPPSALPPGHPPIAGMGARQDSKDGPQDDATLPPGTISVHAEGLPPDALHNLQASLIAIRRNDSEVTTSSIATSQLDPAGHTRLVAPPVKNIDSPRVTIVYDDVPYHSPMFRLSRKAGKKVSVRLYEVTNDIDQARVGVQAFAYVEPRDHHLYVEQLFRFANLSDRAWQSKSLPVRLPARAEAVTATDHTGPLSVSPVPGQGVVLKGAVPPGGAEVTFHYHVPYPNDDVARLDLGMPPRVGAVRVMTATGPGLSLHVSGLAPAVVSRNNLGKPLLIAEGAVPPGGDQIESLHVVLGGLPSGGHARLIALAITILAMGAGLIGAFRLRTPVKRTHPEAMAKQRDTLLASIATLSSKRSRGQIDEARYEVERDVLLDDLARVLEASEEDLESANTLGETLGTNLEKIVTDQKNQGIDTLRHEFVHHLS